MAFLVIARWRARPGSEETVLSAVRALAPLAREEPACRVYEPCRDPERPGEITIVEIYDDEAGYQVHLESPHVQHYGFGIAIPLLETRTRETYETL